MNLGMLGAFAGVGALEGVGTGLVHQRNLDEAYQMQAKSLDAAKQLDDARQQDKERERLAEINAKKNSMQGTDKELMDITNNQQQGKITINTNTQDMPGVPPSMGQDAPITPRTQAVQVNPMSATVQQPAPVQGAMQPQTQQPTQPQGQAPQQTPAPAQMPSTQPQAQPAQMQTPNAVDPQSPAGQITAATAIKNAVQVKQSGGTDAEAYVAALPGSDAFKNEWKNFAHTYGISDSQDLQTMMNLRAKYANEGKSIADWQKDVVTPYVSAKAKSNSVDENQLSPNEQSRFAALRNTGDVPAGELKLPASSPTELRAKMTAQTNAAKAEDGATNQMDSLVRQAGLQGKYPTGYGAGTVADISNTVSSWLGSGQSDKSAAAQQMMKDTVDQITAIAQSMPPGTRQGFQMTNLEGKAVADVTKGEVPNLNIINSMFGKALSAQQAAYIQRTQGVNEPQEYTNLLMERYKENNPVFEADGKTPNTHWMSAQDWIEQGAPKSVVTRQSVAIQGKENINTKMNAAEQGQNPSEVGNSTQQTAPKTVNFNDLPK